MKKLEKTQLKDDIKKKFLISQGLNYVCIQQREFIRVIKNKVQSLYNNYLPSYYQSHKSSLTETKKIDDIRKGMFLGAVEVDISINENLYDYFKEYPTFFVLVMF